MAQPNPQRTADTDPMSSPLRRFDGANRNYYDVELIVEEQKFYVLKGHLAMHSEVFDRMFFGSFSEKNKIEVELADVDAHYFQIFLEVINGEVCLTDENIEGTLKVADFLSADTAMKRCEEYMLHRSEMPIKTKFEISVQYHFGELTAKTISDISSAAELVDIVPEQNELDDATKLLLFQKSMELHRQNAPPPSSSVLEPVDIRREEDRAEHHEAFRRGQQILEDVNAARVMVRHAICDRIMEDMGLVRRQDIAQRPDDDARRNFELARQLQQIHLFERHANRIRREQREREDAPQ